MTIQEAYLKEVCFHFKFLAKTSRNTLKEKVSHFVVLEGVDGQIGIGECSPIYGLSIEKEENLRIKLNEVIEQLNVQINLDDVDLKGYPSIQFALDTAIRDLHNGGQRLIFKNGFSEGKRSIHINGLIWMADLNEMLLQVDQKVLNGFNCIKIKIGSHDFLHELAFLKDLRNKHGNDIEIRLDANGAFDPDEALDKLEKLSVFNIHSIEQPIRSGQVEMMKTICAQSPIPIALDEELIGVDNEDAHELLSHVHPKYIIIKPSLIGRFSVCDQWIKHAESLGIGWWATSALESNIGLNAIAQWVSEYKSIMYQGLGTGQIYADNIPSSLMLKGQELTYAQENVWELKFIES